MAPDPGARYARAELMSAALVAAMSEVPEALACIAPSATPLVTEAAPDSRSPPRDAPPRVRRSTPPPLLVAPRRAPIEAVALAGMLVLAAGLVLGTRHFHSRAAPQHAVAPVAEAPPVIEAPPSSSTLTSAGTAFEDNP